MRIPSGVTDQYVYFVAVDATDLKTRETGLSSFTVYRSRDGAAAAAMTTPTVNETDATNMPGVYELLLDEDTTIAAGNDSEEMALHITQASMSPVTRVVELYRPKITAGNTLGVAADGDVSGNVDGSVGSISGVTFPTNFTDLAITVTTGNVTVGTSNDKTGYSLAADQSGATIGAVNAIAGTIGTLDALDTAQDSQHTATQAAVAALNDLSAAQVNAEVDTALVGYDGPTTTEMVAAFTEIKGATWASGTDTLEAIRDRGDAAWITATSVTVSDKTGFSLAADQSAVTIGTVGVIAGTIGTLDALDTAQDSQHATTQASVAALNDLSALQVNAEVDTALADYDGPTNTEMTAAFTEIKGATWAATDTLEAIRDRGDAAWITATSVTVSDKTGFSLAADQSAVTLGTVNLIAGTIGTLDALDTAQDTQHANTQADIAALNDMSAADVNAQCDAALETYGLDHLVSAAVVGTDVTDNSIVSLLASKSGTADWDSYDNTTDSLEALRDRGDAAWTTGAGGTPPDLLVSTTIATLASQTSFTLTAGSADDDAYNGHILIVTDQSTSTQIAVGEVSDYVGLTKTVTLSADPGVFTMAVGDSADIIAATGAAGSGATAAEVWSYTTRVLTANTNLNDPTAAAVRSEIDINSTQLAAIVADTNELQADWANGGRLDLIVDATKAVTDNLPDAGALTSIATAAALVTVDTVVDAIKIKTDQITFTTPNKVDTRVDYVGLNAVTTPDDFKAEVSALATSAAVATVDGVVDAIKLVTDNLPDSGALTSLATAVALATVDTVVDGVKAVTDNIPNSGVLQDLTAAQVNAEVVDALNVDTYPESASIPAATASLVDKISWTATLARNEIVQDASTQAVRNDADSADVATATLTYDGTSFTRGQFT